VDCSILETGHADTDAAKAGGAVRAESVQPAAREAFGPKDARISCCQASP
jgi:hypothetical protein